jgi:hypothetical protein
MRHFGKVHSKAAWSVFLDLGRELAENGQDTETFVYSLFSALTPPLLTGFFALVSDGTLLSWCRNGWILKQLAPSFATALGKAPDQVEAFIKTCWKAKHLFADELVGNVLTHIEGFEKERQLYLLKALDAGRAIDPSMPAFRMLMDMFTGRVPQGSSTYEIVSLANDKVRLEIYDRAKGTGPIAECCRRLLATLECMRREGSRPDDEKRHPALCEGMAWTDVLIPQ